MAAPFNNHIPNVSTVSSSAGAASSSSSQEQEQIHLTESELHPTKPPDLVRPRLYLRSLKKPAPEAFCNALEKLQESLKNGTIGPAEHRKQGDAIRTAMCFLQDGLSLDEKFQQIETLRNVIKEKIKEIRESGANNAEEQVAQYLKLAPDPDEEREKAQNAYDKLLDILNLKELTPEARELSMLAVKIISDDVRVQLANQDWIVAEGGARAVRARNEAAAARANFFPDQGTTLNFPIRELSNRNRSIDGMGSDGVTTAEPEIPFSEQILQDIRGQNEPLDVQGAIQELERLGNTTPLAYPPTITFFSHSTLPPPSENNARAAGNEARNEWPLYRSSRASERHFRALLMQERTASIVPSTESPETSAGRNDFLARLAAGTVTIPESVLAANGALPPESADGDPNASEVD